ncbi:MAG: sulfotransferase [Anaerolineales bacterium]|nr:sulfotransferase [Anaerolineales bacterium]
MMKILLLSSERSGSNLLRAMFAAHPALSAPPAPQIARVLAPWAHLYGDLREPARQEILVRDALALIKNHPQSWEAMPSVAEVLSGLDSPSFWTIFAGVYSAYARREGKSGWFSKENNLFDYAFEIRHFLPDAKLLYLARDGRDYALSMRKMPGGHRHVYLLAKQWQQEQRQCLRIWRQLDQPGQIQLIRYEDLLQRPEDVLRKACSYLGIDFAAEMLTFHQQDKVRQMADKSAYWQNLSRPIMQSNFGKYKQGLSEAEIALFEKVAGQELQLLGYPLEGAAGFGDLSPLRQELIRVQDYFWRRRGRSKQMQESMRAERAEVIQAIRRRLQGAAGEQL